MSIPPPELDRHVDQQAGGLVRKALATLGSYRDEWLQMQGLRVDRRPPSVRQQK